MNTITADQINQLDSSQLPYLLLKLLYNEHLRYHFPNVYISVPENINRADGGEDGRLQTSDSKNSQWIKNTDTLFQSKAAKMQVSKCHDEVLTKKKVLKPRVREILDKKGTYLLFTNDLLVPNDIIPRIAALRNGIKQGKLNEGLSEENAGNYAEEAKLEIMDANLIRDWTNQYITAVSYVQRCTHQTKPLGLFTYEELNSYPHEEFKSNDDINKIIKEVRKIIYEGQHVRIEGVSGIGKTRLINEVFNPGELKNESFDLIRKAISEQMVYFNISENANEVLNYVRSHAQDLQAILVLDNCPPDLHIKFQAECDRYNSQLKIVSLDFDQLAPRYSNTVAIFELKDEFYKSITEQILTEKYHGVLTDAAIRYLIDFSEGNTKMAIDFANATIKDQNLHEMVDNDLIKKLLFGRNDIVEEEFRILKILAIFKVFEYPGIELYEIDRSRYDQLLEGVEFISTFFKISREHIEKTIKKFLLRGNIERRGNKIMVRPNALALKLAIIFWEETSLSGGENFINSIPKSYQVPIAEQLQNLKGAQHAKTLVGQLWGFDGNFSTAELLNSRTGSHLFRSVVIVNPEATTETLVKHYLNKSKNDLKGVKEGRQNLIWALERLCFRKAVFYDATRVLMSFAVSENEFFYSNNATSYFKQLFSFQLAGTEVAYVDRIPVLKWALDKKDFDFDKLTLETCASVLNKTIYHRMIGAEHEGGATPLKDYEPKTMAEVYTYVDELLEILKCFLDSSSQELRQISQKALVGCLNDLDRLGYDVTQLGSCLKKIVNNPIEKKEVLGSLNISLNSPHSSDKLKALVVEFIDSLAPQSIPEKIAQIVSDPYVYNRGEDHVEHKIKTINLAREIHEDRISLVPYVKNLMIGTQYQGLEFGESYGDIHGYDQKLLDAIQDFLMDVEITASWNTAFLTGYLNNLQKSEVQKVFNRFVDQKSAFAFVIFQTMSPILTNAKKLLDLIDEGADPEMYRFARRELAKLPLDELVEYFQNMEERDESTKAQIIKIVYWYIKDHQREELMQETELVEYLKGFVRRSNLLELVLNSKFTEFYEWEELMIYLLTVDRTTATFVALNITETYKNRGITQKSGYHIANVANSSLVANWDAAWPVYGDLLIKEGEALFFSEIFDMNWVTGIENSHPFFKNKKQRKKLEIWLLDNPRAAKWMIRYLPLYGDANGWFSLTRNLIDTFGEDPDFLNTLSNNLHSMMTAGSRIPYLKSRIRILKELKDHDFENIRSWVTREIEHFEKEVKMEKIRDEETGL
ncbi:hypothetical protein [Christiangramia sp. OXR-203]|uniref:hypothetical protein n=1 Tax=Christiangramia sp. OXR-203 TaxID=3100176 RepID=UPI002AC9ACF4|nr:hypothetical protein [Christiangramia sp. OXR-203]WPY99842.1 hypothetical protein T8I65_06410 [Christiangramia sp. OXR-203]